ncbi:MAG: M20/M25/M40 family metallo-hydrolase [Methyloligellaceae bacterium]
MPLHADTFDAEEILGDIMAWGGVESPTTDTPGVNLMMDLALEALGGLGARVERLDGIGGYGDVVKGRFAGPDGAEGPGVLILCHLDTVHPVGTLDGPLPLRREGDRLYGPGVYDMKGGGQLALHAIKALQNAGRTPRLPLTVMFTPDEEVGSPSSRERIEDEARRHKFVLVPEPLKMGRKVVTGRHAIQRFEISSHGRPAHAGLTKKSGRSAIRVMARLIERIEAMTDYKRGLTYSVGVIRGGTFVNVVPTVCTAEALCVAPSDEDLEEIKANMIALAGEEDEVEVRVTVGVTRPVFRPHAGTMALYETAQVIAAEIDIDLRHGQFGGGSDGNFTGALEIPTLDGLGVDGDGGHTFEEHLLISSLVPRCRLLAGLIETLA